MRTRRLQDASGQASVELVALLPLVAVIAGLAWQAVVAGQAIWLAGSAARSGARAAAVGGDVRAAARGAVPRPLRAGLEARTADGAVRVRLPIPAIVGGARLGRVSAEAALPPQAP